MAKKQQKAKIDSAAQELRNLVWERSDGDLLGSENDLTELLGVSRPTVRQIARLLEREGLLRVVRGIHGGYFARRPSVESVAKSVTAYLKMLEANHEDLTEIASAVWMVAVKKIASSVTDEVRQVMARLRKHVLALSEEATFNEVLAIEEESRQNIFKIIHSPYIELIFLINRTFSETRFPRHPASLDGTEEHRKFVRAWRKVKLLEIDAITDGDAVVGEMTARHNRNIFHKRLWGRPMP